MVSPEGTGGVTPGTQAARELKAWLAPEIEHLKDGQAELKAKVDRQNGRIGKLETLHSIEDGRRDARASTGLTTRTWLGLITAMAGTAVAAVGVAIAAVNGGV